MFLFIKTSVNSWAPATQNSLTRMITREIRNVKVTQATQTKELADYKSSPGSESIPTFPGPYSLQ